MPTLDPRLLSVTIEIEDNVSRTYRDLAIRATGKKFASALHNTCEIRIANVDKTTRDYLLTVGTPFNRIANLLLNRIIVEAGRQSYGLSTVYAGNITTVTETQPPDIWLVINAQASRFQQGQAIGVQATPVSSLRSVAQQLADELGLALEYAAPEFTLTNYQFSGSVGNQIDTLNKLYPNIDVYIDDSAIVVQSINNSRPSSTLFFLSQSTGLIGKPSFDAYGVECTVLYTPDVVLGSRIELSTAEYPAADGEYTIYELDFDLANREQPFYYRLRARRPFT